jgi:glycosyltransferase TcdB-like subunit of Tc toxin/VCBS repeat protein
MLEEVRDTNGNYLKYQYTKDLGQVYPYKVTYTHGTSTTGRFEVEFLTETRSDVATSSFTGFTVVAAKRINEIQIKVDGSWTRKYALGYATGDNGARTMLSTITESGRDDAGTITTLPAVTLQYQTVNKGWSESAVSIPIVFGNYTTLADVNGDSLVDIVDSIQYWNVSGYEISHTLETYINNGNGWTASSTWRTPMYMFVSTTGAHPPNADRGARFADVNGDGLADIVQSWDGVASTTKTWLNNGAGWTATSTYAPPVHFTDTSSAYDLGVRVLDINGDGLTDIVNNSTTYVNNGNDWVASSTWSQPLGNLYQSRPVQFEDVNGDGLIDLTQSQSGGMWGAHNEVWINNGAGWTLDTQWTVPVYFVNELDQDQGTRMGDANGDGLIDILRSPEVYGSGVTVYLNTGHAWVASSTWTIPTTFINTGNGEPQTWLADVDGDGLIDLLKSKDDISNNMIYLNNTNKTDLLVKITYPQGGNTSFAYKTAAEYKNGSILLNPGLPFTVNTVSTVALDDGLGTIATTSYSYQGGSYYVASSTDRKLGGFQKIVKTDPAGNITNTYFHQGNTSNTSTGEYQDDGSKIGRVYRTEVYDGSSNLYSKAISKWDKTSLSTGRTWVNLAQQVDSSYDGDADHKDKATSYAYSSTTGNVIQKFDWGEVTGQDDGSFSDIGSDLASTTISYAASTTAPGFVSSQLTHDQSANKVKETRYYYDDLSLGSVTKGNQTKKEDWIVSSTYASTTKTYNGISLPTPWTVPISTPPHPPTPLAKPPATYTTTLRARSKRGSTPTAACISRPTTAWTGRLPRLSPIP